MDWHAFVKSLQRQRSEVHRFLPPCTEEQVANIKCTCGALPPSLLEMLRVFGGAELFIEGIPLLTIFGAPHPLGSSAVDWPPTCWLAVQVKSWTSSGR